MAETYRSVKGLNELSRKLSTMHSKIAGQVLRSAAMTATLPVVKEMRRAAPKGKRLHRTYKGNLVAPGFLSRSIKRESRYKYGTALVNIGVKHEAFYGVNFVERGTKPHRIPKEGSKKALYFGGRFVSHVNHPGARAKPWFVKSFVKMSGEMLDRFGDQLGKKIERHMK